jgi:iron(III) transport system substrate-binding protein
MRKRAIPGLAAVVVASLVAGCGSSGSADAASAGRTGQDVTLTVYNAQHEDLTQSWVDAFTKETGIKVTLRNGDDSEMSNQLKAEGTASPADVFLTENSPGMTTVENAGLLADVDPATIAQVPAEYRPSSGKWVGIAARSTVFVYNTSKLTEGQLPKSIGDLADPRWKGRWGASPSGADFHAIVSAMLQLDGKDATLAWLKAMKTNAKMYKGNTTVMKAVNAGQLDAGVIYHYYWFGDQANTKENSNNVKLYFFKHKDPGAFVSVSGGGVLKSSKHPVEAQQLLAFITSRQGQTILSSGSAYEYSVASGVAANPALPPLDQLDAPAIEESTLNGPEVIDLMTEAGLL